MPSLYPEIEPFSSGLVDVGDGNCLRWEMSGNRNGFPAVVLHGGPGSGLSEGSRRFFDPQKYRIILFDQRGCGQSTPNARRSDADLSVNTTDHLLGDIELLRRHLNVERWLMLGHSWGTTLGPAYAERHPERIAALVLIGVTMTRRSEIDWLCRGLAPLFPEQWERFRAGVPSGRRDDDLVAAYYDLLNDPDPAIRAKAADDWHDWEAAFLSVDPGAKSPERWADPRYRMTRARIVTHYFHHNAWLKDGILLRRAHRLAAIPGVMVQGRLDLAAPLVTAWELSRVWRAGELVIVANAGHSTADRGMTEAIVSATDRFAQLA
ncbi:MAG: prolyl aminopeptidase [Propylenella sp.]